MPPPGCQTSRVTTDHGPGSDLLRLASADNFRDVAGPGHPTRDGGRVRTGVCLPLQRAAADRPSTRHAIAGLGRHERARPARAARGRRPPRRRRARRGLDPPATWPASRPAPVAELPDARRRARGDDRRLPRLRHRRARAGLVRRAAAPGSRVDGGPQLFHCTAGKDRTGWAAALLLHVAGVDARRRRGRLPAHQRPLASAPGRSTSAWWPSTSAPTRSPPSSRRWSPTPPTSRPPTPRPTRRTAPSTATWRRPRAGRRRAHRRPRPARGRVIRD